MLKRLIAVIAVFSIILLLPSFDVRASAAADLNDEEFFGYMLESAMNYEEDIDISSFAKRGKWKYSEVSNLIKAFYLRTPELFFVDNKNISISYNEDAYIYKISFNYLYSKDKAKKMRAEMDKAAAAAIKGITDDMTDVQKALIVHDYLVLNTAYDHSMKKRSAYNCLVEHSCVCQGYTLAYIYVMKNVLGFQCSTVVSDSQNHAWNYLMIDGKWYHVDLTADDGSITILNGKKQDKLGEVSHSSFLLSDSACKKSSELHTGWDTLGLPAAKSTKYDKYFWKDSRSPIVYCGGKWYYVTEDKNSTGLNYKSGKEHEITALIRTYDFDTGKSKTVEKVEATWYLTRDADSGKSLTGKTWYKRTFLKLAVCGDKLYYNTPDKIYRYDPETGKTKAVYTLKKTGKYIYSVTAASDKKLKIGYKKDLSYPDEIINIKLA